ncbi:MAG: GGDEF domain-containing protein [Hyphomicrobiaceae bacterium]|nr:GGDEF domain-containing protein [Hyphomicrobiaceae bacterium]
MIALGAIDSTVIERLIQQRNHNVAFPGAIEARFRAETGTSHARKVSSAAAQTAVIYNTLLVADLVLVPDVLWLSLILHVFVVTPLLFFASHQVRITGNWCRRHWIAATMPLAMLAQILVCFAASTHPYSAHYLYFLLPMLMYGNIVLRIDFRIAIGLSILTVLTMLLVGLIHPAIPAPIVAMMTLTATACAALTIFANLHLDRDIRLAWLYALRDRVRHLQAETASRIDVLTGLANRRSLEQAVASLWASSETAMPVSLVMIDVDHFKSYNDHYGHPAGDACLQRIASAVRMCLRSRQDLAVRYGGEEILVLLPGVGLDAASHVAERIRAGIVAAAIPHAGIPHAGSRVEPCVTASLGVASGELGATTYEDLVAAADTCLYSAKRAGRNRVATMGLVVDPEDNCLDLCVG